MFQECQRKAWKNDHYKTCKNRNTVPKTAPKQTERIGQKLIFRETEVESSGAEKKNEIEFDEYEIISTTVTKMALHEDICFPVIDKNGKHLFSVTQKQINENKDLA